MSPVQKVVEPFAVIAGVGGGALTVTAVGAEVALHPLPSKACTVKLPDAETVMDCVVAPLDQSHDVAALAVRTTSSPVQNVVAPSAVIVGVGGFGFTLTTTGLDVAKHPFASVTVTVYESAVVTVIDCAAGPFTPFDQE